MGDFLQKVSDFCAKNFVEKKMSWGVTSSSYREYYVCDEEIKESLEEVSVGVVF